MAYAAVNSVIFAVRDLLDSPHISSSSSTIETLKYAYDEASYLESILGRHSDVLTASDEQEIIDEARRLQDAVEFGASEQFLEQPKLTFSLNLEDLEQDIDRFYEIVEKMKGRIEELWEEREAKKKEEDMVENEDVEEDVSTSAVDMVGLDDEFRRLRDDYGQPADPDRTFLIYYMVLWITGMAGVGKTAIVERVYHDPSVKANFQGRAFVRVGQEYRLDRVFRAITAQLNRGDEKMRKETDNEDAKESFLATLRAKRCLVVLDDVWDEILKNVIDYEALKVCGSRILLTGRILPFIPYNDCGRKLRFLNEDESWELLKRKVFDEEDEVCPPLLVKAGKKIAEKCEGLPLLIIAVANVLLSKVEKNPESWNRVAEKPNSVLEEASHQISEVLITSYHHMHEKHRLHFLYIAVFPQSFLVFTSTIVNLWFAEGFYHLIANVREFHEERVFKVLRENNLVIVGRWQSWPGDGIKTFKLHCAYWYLCKRLAKDNRFMYIMNSYADGVDERVEGHNRFAIQTNVLLAIDEVRENIMSVSTVRSLLCTGPYHEYQLPVHFEWKLLRVLDALAIRFYAFPAELVELIHLRYLALTCNANLPPSISKLWMLQFLILHQHSRIKRVGVEESFVPAEIWDLQELMHLEIMGRNLPHPPNTFMKLPNLRELLDVGVKCCTKEVLESIPKLNKLRIQIDLAPDAPETSICFDQISGLDDLLSFQSMVLNPAFLRPQPPLSLPDFNPIKLTLSGFGYPWEEMKKIAKLPHLQVLKLRCYAFRGEKWEANEEMRFPRLRYLYIEDTDLVQWTVTQGKNMPWLDRLTMKNCHKLHEIPMLSSMDLRIQLVDCNPLAETCARQRYTDPRLVRVTASYSWNKKK